MLVGSVELSVVDEYPILNEYLSDIDRYLNRSSWNKSDNVKYFDVYTNSELNPNYSEDASRTSVGNYSEVQGKDIINLAFL